VKNVYTAVEKPLESSMDLKEAVQALKAFFASMVLKKDLGSYTSVNQVQKDFGFMSVNYPAWAQAETWLTNVLQTTLPGVESYDFAQMELAAEQVSMQLGGFLDGECRTMKDTLLEAEERDSGRVQLSKFYQKGMEKGLHFVEKPAYMRQLGALDESLPGEPRVLVANWMSSPSNCLIDTGFYSICCVNECESVMSQLERTIGAPQASPERIASEAAKLSTSTVTAPRTLPENIIARLQTVADRNGGQVPLYGRLFAQWLHFAFPRECPYPHTTGTTNPLTPEDYLTATSEKAVLSASAMNEYISKVAVAEDGEQQGEDDLLTRWSDEEEVLFLPTGTHTSAPAKLLRIVLALAVLTGVLVAGGDAIKRFGGSSNVLGKSWQSEHCKLV